MPPAPPPEGEVGYRVWSPQGYNSRPEGSDGVSDGLFHLYCGFGAAGNGWRTSVHSSRSQTAILTTARRMIDQGTYASSLCPFECARKLVRHTVVPTNEDNLLGGAGLNGEGFLYPGRADHARGFARFGAAATGASAVGSLMLVPTHMSHNVTLEQCDAIVRRHELLASHAVWLIYKAHEAEPAAEERLGDCGMFLGTRSEIDAQLWRAFYDYARLILKLGHFESFVDSDVKAALVHSSAEGACDGSNSRVCLWWSEFDLDDEEYSCRPKTDASNIVTPAVLLATLAESNVHTRRPRAAAAARAARAAAVAQPVARLGALPARLGALHQVPQDGLRAPRGRGRWGAPRAARLLALEHRRGLAAVLGAPRPLRGRGALQDQRVHGPLARRAVGRRAQPARDEDGRLRSALRQRRLVRRPQQYIENNAPNAAQRWAYLNDARFCSDGSFGAYSEDAALFGFNCDLGTHASACGLNCGTSWGCRPPYSATSSRRCSTSCSSRPARRSRAASTRTWPTLSAAVPRTRSACPARRPTPPTRR